MASCVCGLLFFAFSWSLVAPQSLKIKVSSGVGLQAEMKLQI